MMKKMNKAANIQFMRELGIVIVFVVILIALMILSPNAFARPANLMNIVKQASINGILATGMMFVIIAGGIDLS
jgi:ribose/xylose/arabinose/galactoside ABC-type transport system permease subunit